MRRTYPAIITVSCLLASLVLTAPAKQPQGPRGQKKPFVRKPIGPLLGHIDHRQALLHYRTAREGPYRLVLTKVDPPGGASKAEEASELGQNQQSLQENDYCVSWRIQGLEPNQEYAYRLEQEDQVIDSGGTLRTFPDPGQPARISLGFGSCVNSKGDHQLWHQVSKSGCQGFVMLGDTPYIDSPKLEHIRPRRRQLLRLLDQTTISRKIPFWWTWDDHDSFYRGNKEQWKKDNCRKAFIEYTAQDSYGENEEAIYTKFRLGPVEVFVLDTRWWYRTTPSFADPTKASLLGKPQWQWLQRELKASEAPIKVLACGVIWYKKSSEGDSWLDYPHERAAVFEFLGKQKIAGVVLVGGDIHASSFCRFKTTDQVGYDLRSLTISPMHDGVMERHNYKDRDYLLWGEAVPNVFLRLTVDSTQKPTTVVASWIQMTGKIIHQERLTLDDLTPAP